jgi:ABC-2 type transport system permease protein
VRGWLPPYAVELVASLSFLVHFERIMKGVLDIRDVIFFASVMGVFLFANVVTVELKKGV